MPDFTHLISFVERGTPGLSRFDAAVLCGLASGGAVSPYGLRTIEEDAVYWLARQGLVEREWCGERRETVVRLSPGGWDAIHAAAEVARLAVLMGGSRNKKA